MHRKIITVPEEITKSETLSKIIVPYSVRDYVDLRMKECSKDELIFTVPPETIAWNIKKIFKEHIDVNWTKGIGKHITRDLFATIMSDRDISFNTIQLIMSHTPTSILGRHYIASYSNAQLVKMESALRLYENIAKGLIPPQEVLTEYTTEVLDVW